jgi:hypothetical protein
MEFLMCFVLGVVPVAGIALWVYAMVRGGL